MDVDVPASIDTDATSADAPWPAVRVRRLRTHLGETQEGFTGRLGTRQQTVSAWERGESVPRRMARRLLHLVAEEHGFYGVEPHAEAASPAHDARPGEPAA